MQIAVYTFLFQSYTSFTLYAMLYVFLFSTIG